MNLIDLAMRWLHIIPAVTLLGGIFYQRIVLLPLWADREDGDKMWETTFRRWSRVVMLCTMPLLVSGLVNAVRTMTGDPAPGTLYHALVGVKLLLALGILFIAALLAGRSAAAEKARQNLAFWLRGVTLMGLLLLLVAGGMRLVPREPKSEEPASSEETMPEYFSPFSLG